MKSLALFTVLLVGFAIPPQAHIKLQAGEKLDEPPGQHLVMRGRVTAIELRRTDPHYVDCKIDLNLEFVNEGVEPIIILRPDEAEVDGSFWLGGVSLARTEAAAESGSYVFDLQFWPSVNRSPGFLTLAQKLNQRSPPEALTRTLQHNQSWVWVTSTSFRFFYETGSMGLGWDGIEKIKQPLWLRVSCGMWPHNLEHASHGISKRLQHRWRTFGHLWLDPESAHNILTSEPMILKINETSVIDSK